MTTTKKGSKKKPNQKVTEITELLRCELTDKEIREASEALARNIDEGEQFENDKKAVNEDFKAKIAQVAANIQLNNTKVRDKCEFRRVDCERTYDYGAGTITVVRLDTKKMITKRKMLADERQRQINFDDFDESEVNP